MSKCNLNLNGIPVEKAENSNLYRQLENYFQGDVNKAISTWANVFTEDFGYVTKKNKVKSNRLDSDFNSKILLQEEQELIKGLGGKKTDLNDPINVHPDVQGVFSTTNIKVAEQYKGDKGISVFKLPVGTTVEYITVKSEGLPLSKIREEETRLINESTSDVVKLDTIDGRGSEIQFIIKDEAILQDAKPFSNIDITEPSLKEALIISETLNTEKAKLDLEDIVDIKNTMSEKGIESSKELLRQLNSLFRSKGYFEIDENKLYKNNFFTRDEVNNLVANPKLQDKLAETIRALDNQDEFFNPLSKLDSAFNHKNYSKTNVLGGYKNIPYAQIEEDLKEIGAETTNIEDFKSQLSQYGYEGILAKMENDTKFLDKIYDEYSTFKKIDSYEIVRGELQPVEKGLSKSLLTKTMLEGVSSTEIREDIDFVIGIEKDVWLEVAEDIKLILKEIEKEAIKFNIDLIGFSEKYQDREGVIDLLNNLEDVTLLLDKKAIDNPTIDKFIESYNNLFPEVENNYVLEQNNKYPENTVYIRTTASDTIMFDDYGLISLGGGFYHAVDMDVSIEELEASIEAENIEEVKLRKPPFKTENIIKYNLYAELYNYNIESKESVLPQTQSIDIDYLKGNFKDDLYSYILKEKIKDSSIYNNLLKDITIDANGINTRNIDRNLLTTIFSSNNILNNLVNYGALRRDSGFESLITNPSSNAFNSLFKEINSDIKEVTTDYIQEGDFIITNSFENFINVNEVIYQEVSDNLFKKVAEVDPVFNNIPLTNKITIPTDILKKSIKFNESILLNDENLLSLSNSNSLKETTERIECNG